jgi:hypothetical protein
MYRTFLLVGVAHAVCFVLAGHANAQTEPTARDLAAKFLDHMEKCTPVAGTFRILTVCDPEIQEAFRKKSRENAIKEGYGVAFGPEKPEFHCRWAWDGSREMLETLSGSNEWKSFFATPEGHLAGAIKGNFNLEKARPSNKWRPASFYFVSGARTWSQVLKNCDLKIEPGRTNAPAGRVILAAKSGNSRVELEIERETGTLHGWRTLLADGKLLAELIIEKLRRNPDGRVFPVEARALLFQPTTGKLDTTYVMSAREISFPTSKAEMDAAFRMILPEGTLISDYMLSQQIHLKGAMSASDVLAGKVSGKPTEFKTTKPLIGKQTAANTESWFWWSMAVVMSVPLALYLSYRGYRICKAHGRPG